jgi:hypothetical protein
MTAEEPLGGDAATEFQLEVITPPDRMGRARGWLGSHRPSPFGLFVVGFVFLLGAVAAVGFAQFTSSGVAPWASILTSGAAVLCTVAALVLARNR